MGNFALAVIACSGATWHGVGGFGGGAINSTVAEIRSPMERGARRRPRAGNLRWTLDSFLSLTVQDIRLAWDVFVSFNPLSLVNAACVEQEVKHSVLLCSHFRWGIASSLKSKPYATRC